MFRENIITYWLVAELNVGSPALPSCKKWERVFNIKFCLLQNRHCDPQHYLTYWPSLKKNESLINATIYFYCKNCMQWTVNSHNINKRNETVWVRKMCLAREDLVLFVSFCKSLYIFLSQYSFNWVVLSMFVTWKSYDLKHDA